MGQTSLFTFQTRPGDFRVDPNTARPQTILAAANGVIDVPRSALRRLGGGATRERHQQYAARIGAVDDQVRDPMRQRVGLAGSGACDHEQRSKGAQARCAILDGLPLFRIETVEVSAIENVVEAKPES